MYQSVIPVFFSTDNSFAVPTYIAIYSLLANHHGDKRINVYILTSADFTETNNRLLKSLAPKFCFAEISIINMRDSYSSVTIHSQNISTATMYRLMIPKIVNQVNDQMSAGEQKIDKCIYLDSDLVVEQDISEFYNIDIDGYFVAGVRDKILSDNKLDSLKMELGISSLDKYINAGVLLLNIKEINKQGIAKKLEMAGNNAYRHNDQDVINSVLYDGIKVLPLKYNVFSTCIHYNDQDSYEQYGFFNIVEAREKPFIIHYILRTKPWLYKHSPLSGYWWKYVKIQDKDLWREIIQQFLKAHKVPLHARIRENIIAACIYLGVYNVLKRVNAQRKRIQKSLLSDPKWK